MFFEINKHPKMTLKALIVFYMAIIYRKNNFMCDYFLKSWQFNMFRPC